MRKRVYQCDQNGYFLCKSYADPSPLEEDAYLIPAGCVELAPPEHDITTQRARWEVSNWVLDAIPQEQELEQDPEVSRGQLVSQVVVLRDKMCGSGVSYGGHIWQTDQAHQADWTYLRGLARELKFDGVDMEAPMQDASGDPWLWRTLDGDVMPLTPNLVIGITDAGAALKNKAYTLYRKHIDAINATDDYKNYNVNSGWDI